MNSRIISFDELQSGDYETGFLEVKDEPKIYPIIIYFGKCYNPEFTNTWIETVEKKHYMKLARVWTARPTQEMRDAAVWEEMSQEEWDKLNRRRQK